jgi:hypothetical protein
MSLPLPLMTSLVAGQQQQLARRAVVPVAVAEQQEQLARRAVPLAEQQQLGRRAVPLAAVAGQLLRAVPPPLRLMIFKQSKMASGVHGRFVGCSRATHKPPSKSLRVSCQQTRDTDHV